MKNFTTKEEITTLKGQVEKGDLLVTLRRGKRHMSYVTNITDRSVEVEITNFYREEKESFTYNIKYTNKGNIYMGGASEGNEHLKKENLVLGFIKTK